MGETNWYTLWDKPGWIACPKGQLLYALRRKSCTALSCLDTGSCAAGCEGESYIYQLRHCYHDLGWYNSFDKAGWSKCLPDYFVAGLYRSCESLYCLQMAKCCSLKESGAAPLIMRDGLGLVRQAVMPSSLDSSVPRHTPSTQLTLHLIVALFVATRLNKVI